MSSVKEDFRDQLPSLNPGHETAVEQAFALDWLAGYRDEVAHPKNLDASNLADLIAGHLIAVWALVQQQNQIMPQAVARVHD